MNTGDPQGGGGAQRPPTCPGAPAQEASLLSLSLSSKSNYSKIHKL